MREEVGASPSITNPAFGASVLVPVSEATSPSTMGETLAVSMNSLSPSGVDVMSSSKRVRVLGSLSEAIYDFAPARSDSEK